MKRMVPLGVLLTGTTGHLLCGKFSEFHEFVEWLYGHPIWTHEFASREFADSIRDTILVQHPDLPTTGVPREGFDTWTAQQVAALGETREIEQRATEHTESPLESLARMFPDKPVIVVGTKP